MKMFSSVTAMIKNEKGEYEGIPALRGIDSYELARKNGFEGSEEEWLESIIGDGWVGAFQQLESRTVNGKPLTSNINLTSDDIPISTNDDMSISEAIAAASAAYVAFIGNVNSEMVEAAFGKYNEENIVGLGRALAMYANYKSGGNVNIKEQYPNLYRMHTIRNIQTNSEALNEIAQHEKTDLMEFLNSVDFAREKFSDSLPLHNPDSVKYCVYETFFLNDVTNDITIPIEHSGYYSLKAGLRRNFDALKSPSVGTIYDSVTFKINGVETNAISNRYLTPEDVVTAHTVAKDTIDPDAYVHVRLYNSWSGCNCVPNLSPDDNTSKIAFGVVLTPNEIYKFEGPSGYYRINVPKWMVGCNVNHGLDGLYDLEFSLKIGEETAFSVVKDSTGTFLEQGSYDDFRYIERGEKILLTSKYGLKDVEIFNRGSYMSAILFYNSTGAYPLLDNIKPINTEGASE